MLHIMSDAKYIILYSYTYSVGSGVPTCKYSGVHQYIHLLTYTYMCMKPMNTYTRLGNG
jgi:hypothetical protein